MPLVLAGEPDENAVLEATRRIGRLVEILEGVVAVGELERRAHQAAIQPPRRQADRPGSNPGDDAVNDWIAAMLGIYRTLTGKEPATSVGAPMRANEGKAAGPLIRFLQAVGQPLNIDFSEDAWRSRVRTILKDLRTKTENDLAISTPLCRLDILGPSCANAVRHRSRMTNLNRQIC